MRFGLLLAGLMTAVPAGAVTVVTGTANPVNGTASIVGSLLNTPYEVKGQTTQVRFEIRSGELASSYQSLFWIITDHYKNPDYPDLIFENDTSGSDYCGSDQPSVCPGGIGNPPPASPFLSGFSSTTHSTNLQLFQPASFDHCDQPIFDTDCARDYSLGLADYAFEVKSDKQISYKFVIGDPKFVNASVPEPASWMMMIAGFGLVGAMRRTRLSGPARRYFPRSG
jgi:hypothetical protein